MRRRLLASLLLCAAAAAAQIPNPQVPFTGRIGSGGTFPLFNGGTVIFATDADHVLSYAETTAVFMKATSAVPLTATRTLVAPMTAGYLFTIENATSGGQVIEVAGVTGSGVPIPNGQTCTVGSDGTNYVSAGCTGSGGGGSPGGNPNDIQTSNGAGGFAGSAGDFNYNPASMLFTEDFRSTIPGFSFGNWGRGPSNGSTNAVTWQTNYPQSFTQGLWEFWNVFQARKTGNDDFNFLNINSEFDGACLAFSDECYVPFRDQHAIAATAFTRTVASSAAVPGGNSLTFQPPHQNLYNWGAPRPVIDTSDDVQTLLIPSFVCGPAPNCWWAVGTVSGAPFSVSNTGTLAAEVDVTPNDNNTPTLVTATLNVSSPAGCSAGQLLAISDNFSEAVKLITATPLSGGQQTVTYYSRISHGAGQNWWCGGWAGRWADFPGMDINGQKMLRRVMGTPANNQIVIAREVEAGTDGAFAFSGTWNIYHGGSLIDPRDLGGGVSGDSFAVVSDNDAAWSSGSTAEVTNGMYSFYDFYKDTSAGNNNAYSMGNHFRIICGDGDPTCGDLNAVSHGNMAYFEVDNANALGRYSTWNPDTFIDVNGYVGTFAWFAYNPIAPIFMFDHTSTSAINIVQANDQAMYFQLNGPLNAWYLSGPHITLGAGGGAANTTDLQLNATITQQATAPAGGCSPNGSWMFTQDGKGSFCKAGTWEVVFTAP